MHLLFIFQRTAQFRNLTHIVERHPVTQQYTSVALGVSTVGTPDGGGALPFLTVTPPGNSSHPHLETDRCVLHAIVHLSDGRFASDPHVRTEKKLVRPFDRQSFRPGGNCRQRVVSCGSSPSFLCHPRGPTLSPRLPDTSPKLLLMR